MTDTVYRINPTCVTEGHWMDDGSVPTCMREDCDEGMQMVDYYLDLEEEMCRCNGDDASRCYPHNPEFHSMEGVDRYDRMGEEDKAWPTR